MNKINERCAGIDIGKRFLLCCVLTGAAQDEPRSQTLRFDTTVTALIRLRDWLIAENVTHVVMESTGSYWIPVETRVIAVQIRFQKTIPANAPPATAYLSYHHIPNALGTAVPPFRVGSGWH